MADPIAVGIGGGTGAGKTTLATRLSDVLPDPVTVVSLDDYYRDTSGLTMEERRELNFDHPDAVDWDLAIEQIAALLAGETVSKPRWDYGAYGRHPDPEVVTPGRVVVIEGLFALTRSALLDRYDVTAYLKVPADIRVVRCLERDLAGRGRPVEEFLDRYPTTIRPMHRRYVEPTREAADLVLDGRETEQSTRRLVGRLEVGADCDVDPDSLVQ